MSAEKSTLQPSNIRPLPGRSGERPAKPSLRSAPRNKRLKLVELLLEVTRRMAAYDTLDDVLHALVDMTTTEIGAERGTLLFQPRRRHADVEMTVMGLKPDPQKFKAAGNGDQGDGLGIQMEEAGICKK